MKKAILAALILSFLGAVPVFSQEAGAAEDTGIPPRSYKSWSALPIAMYDNDIGFGYGAKAKFVDFLGKKESFDLILFNSSKGERWYVFTFSLPDIEIRQRRTYPISFDLKAEYDKFLKYSYYGQGMDSREEDETILTHEVKSLFLTVGRGFSPNLSASVTYVFRSIDYSNVQEGPYAEQLGRLRKKSAPYFSFNFSYDTSDSQLHPTRGFRLIFQDDLAVDFSGQGDASYNRITMDFRKYIPVFGEKDVFAFRTLVQYINGDAIPLFDLASLGGGNTFNVMRGFGLNRFLDKGKILANVEYRFPIWWKFGGNVFVDAGSVFPAASYLNVKDTVVDYGVGLRFYMPDFVVRVDVGFSTEGMRLYFNFGHIF